MTYIRQVDVAEMHLRNLDGVGNIDDRRHAAQAFGQCGASARAHIPAFVAKGLKETAQSVQQEMIHALVAIGGTEALAGVEAFADKLGCSQTAGAVAFYEARKMKDAAAVSPASQTSDDTDARLRRIEAKAGNGESRMLDAIALQSALQRRPVAVADRPPLVRRIEGLIPEQDSPFMRRQLVQVLDAVGGREAQAAIGRVAKSDAHPMVRETSQITAAAMERDRTGSQALFTALRRPAAGSLEPA